MNAKANGWGRGALKLLISNAEATKSYHFATGSIERVVPKDLNVLAKNIAKANSAVEIARAVLADAEEHERQVTRVARNEVVNCEGDLIKAELAAKDAEKAFFDRAREAMGVKE